MPSAREVLRQLANKGLGHWVVVTLGILLGLYVGHGISEARMWLEWRYVASRAVQRLTSRVPIVKHVTVVTIGNDEYWAPGLSARVPINRGYLAKLVGVVAQGNPFLIALDFDMRSPHPDGSLVEFPEFERETRELIAQISETSRALHVVLPRAIWLTEGHGLHYRLDSDAWDLAPALLLNPNVHGGYIALPPDLRQIPLAVPLVNSDSLDSFSLAIARAREAEVADELGQAGGRTNLPFASYIPENKFPTRTAQQVLSSDPTVLKSWFGGRLVIVGGEWDTLAADRGHRVDTYLTPAGSMPGVFIHANFVEAILDQRTFEPVPEWVVAALEVVIVLSCVLVFALAVPLRIKIGVWALAVVALIGANYFALQNLGRFFDFFVPLVVIISHIAWEQINEWRRQAREHQACGSHAPASAAAAATIGAILAFGAPAGASGRQLVASQPAAETVRPSHSKPRRAESADPSKFGGVQGRGRRRSSDVDPMGPRPVVREGVESPEPSQPGGPRKDGDRDFEPMGPRPIVREGVESATPVQTGGPRKDEGPEKRQR